MSPLIALVRGDMKIFPSWHPRLINSLVRIDNALAAILRDLWQAASEGLAAYGQALHGPFVDLSSGSKGEDDRHPEGNLFEPNTWLVPDLHRGPPRLANQLGYEAWDAGNETGCAAGSCCCGFDCPCWIACKE